MDRHTIPPGVSETGGFKEIFWLVRGAALGAGSCEVDDEREGTEAEEEEGADNIVRPPVIDAASLSSIVFLQRARCPRPRPNTPPYNPSNGEFFGTTVCFLPSQES